MVYKKELDTYGKRLRYAISLAKTRDPQMSYSKLAREVGIKPQAVQYLCSDEGSKNKRSRYTNDFARVLHVDPYWLATGQGEPEEPCVRDGESRNYSSGKELNFRLLEACIAGLEKYLQETGMELTPDEKSQEVLALYKHFAEETEVDASKVVKLLDFAAKKGVARDNGSGPGKTHSG